MEYSRNIPKICNHNENIGISRIWKIPWTCNIKKKSQPTGRKV